MNKFMWLTLSLIFGFFPALLFAAPMYSSKSISIRVIDLDTKEPIKDAIVIARWELEYQKIALYAESREKGTMKVIEVTTDENGNAKIPAWGPSPIPSNLPSRTLMNPYQPTI